MALAVNSTITGRAIRFYHRRFGGHAPLGQGGGRGVRLARHGFDVHLGGEQGRADQG